jgi:hypothetical protein
MSMTKATEGLYAALAPLGLYALHTDSLIDRELLAYDVAFAVLDDLLDQIEKQAFIQTADGEGLAAHERMMGLGAKPELLPEVRRDLVLYRLAVAPLDFTAAGLERSLLAAGVEAVVLENWPDESVTVHSIRFFDTFDGLDSLMERLSAMLPAHLDWEFDTGILDWDLFDQKGPTWDAWDTADFTWDMFDIDGHNLL